MTGSPKKILIVDDDAFVRDMLGEILRSGGYQTETSENGVKAYENYQYMSGVDLIISDMNMPEMNGLELIKKIRSAGDDVPIIILTVNTDVQVAIDAMQSGANDYLLKDENIQDTIFISVERVLEKFQLKTDLIQKNKELEKSNHELLELNRLKNKFLGIAAHDLRTPIGGIKGLSEFLLDEDMGAINEEQKEYLKLINQTAEEMMNLLDNLLDVSIIESGKLEIHPQVGSLKNLIENRIKLIKIAAEKKNIKIQADLIEIKEALFDPGRIGQVFENLISNAIKFSPPGSNVFVSMKHDSHMVQVTIKDEGPGISEEEQLKVFHEFKKLSVKPTGGEKSTGLGLAIVKKIIETHGGRLTLESKIGLGSAFTFSIPIKNVEMPSS